MTLYVLDISKSLWLAMKYLTECHTIKEAIIVLENKSQYSKFLKETKFAPTLLFQMLCWWDD